MKHIRTVTKTLFTAALTSLSLQAFAGPGTLVTSPLFVNANAKPNIMVLTDTSGSMRHIVPEDGAGAADKYNAATTYISSCGSATMPNDRSSGSPSSLYIRIIGGRPKIAYSRSSSTHYYLGTSAGQRCFDSTKEYNASLHADSGTYAAGIATAIYSGNYLNWYFNYNNTSTIWNASQRYKPGTDYRMSITRETLKTIVDGLDDSVRLGIAKLNGSSGARISENIKTLTATNKTTLKSTIDTFAQSGSTPMAEALHQVGRYFMGDTGANDPGNLPTGSTSEVNGETTGTGGNQLTLHPDTASEAKYNRSTVFPTMASNGNQESPVQYWCQNNFVIFMSDGISNADQNIPSTLQDYDDDCSGGGCSTDDKKSSGSYIYDSTGSDYLDDVAQALFEIDLRPDIDDYDGNEVVNNVRTYTIAFADRDALNNKLLDDSATQGGGQYFTSANASELARDFSAATSNILATTSSASAVTFNTSTLGSDTTIYQAQFSTARWSGEIYSFPITPTTGAIEFNCTLNVAQNCWNASTHIDDLAYNASTFVDNREIITFNKATKKGIAFVTPADFTAPAATELTTTMINDLCAGPDAPLVGGLPCTSATATDKTASQTYLDQMVDYTRGDRTYESISNSPTFRTRQSVLGDIVNANPLFIGTPKLRWPSIEKPSNKFGVTGNRYSDYQTLQKNRISVLYASANDGMLHALRTKSGGGGIRQKAGDELFAFIPSFVFSDQNNEGLHYLAKPSYTHKYYLDLSPTYSDIYGRVKDSAQANFKTTADAWHTVLIGGSRGAVKTGIFALDVTDPLTITESNAADKVLWEFTNSDDADLSRAYSRPTIALTNAIDGSGLNRWAVIVGNGYQDDNGSGTFTTGSTCHAVLYVLFIDGGLDGTWTLGTNPSTADYLKIDTQVGSTTAGNCNGLSTPALADLDRDGILDRVYAGDIQGNMWAFDFTCGGVSCGTSDFKVAYKQGATPKPLFTAKDNQATPAVQPITSKPILARNLAVATSVSNEPNVLVSFGTGQYHASGDSLGTTKINTFYSIWDSGTGKLTDDRSNTASANLVEQVLTVNTTAYGDFRTTTSNTIDWSKKYGWYIDLVPQNVTNYDAEERVVVQPAIRYKTLFFNTLIPNAQTCGYGGTGWLMSVDFNTGGAPKTSIFDVDGDGVVDNNDKVNGNIAVGRQVDGIPASSSFIGDRQYTQTSRSPSIGSPPTPGDPKCGNVDCEDIEIGKGLKEGRLSWRELRPDY